MASARRGAVPIPSAAGSGVAGPSSSARQPLLRRIIAGLGLDSLVGLVDGAWDEDAVTQADGALVRGEERRVEGI